MDESRLIVAIYDAALKVALVHWYLFLAREDRGAGRVYSAKRSMERARSTISDIAATIADMRCDRLARDVMRDFRKEA